MGKNLDIRDIGRLRIRNQRMVGTTFTSAKEVVGWLGAVQSQEYQIAKWSLGMRSLALTDADVDRALANGEILRTHILRPTWHFVLPTDIRWMMALTGPRIAARMRPTLGFPMPEEHDMRRALEALGDALAGGRRMTRTQVALLLQDRGFMENRSHLVAILIRAELDLVIVSGGLEGKTQTYASAEERAPRTPTDNADEDRDWALAELTRRYFTSHGPATIGDFAWWSGLTVADTKRGLSINGAALEQLNVDGTEYWWAGDSSGPETKDDPSPSIHLLQGYDEYLVSYKSPRTPINLAGLATPGLLVRPPLLHALILDSQAIGYWRRVAAERGYTIETKLLRNLSGAERSALAAAVDRYAAFVGRPVQLLGEPTTIA